MHAQGRKITSLTSRDAVRADPGTEENFIRERKGKADEEKQHVKGVYEVDFLQRPSRTARRIITGGEKH